MSRIVVCTMISVDGYTSGPDGDVTAMPMDDAFAEHNADRVRSANRLLFGATSYAGLAGFWPNQVDNPDASPHDRYIAKRYDEGIPITVVSDHLSRDDLEVWAEQTTIVNRSEAHETIQALRDDGYESDVLIFGSQTLWTDLLAHGLLDDLYLMIGPKIVDGDRHAFGGIPSTSLRLVGVRTWRESDSVVLHYATDREDKKEGKSR